MKYIDAEKLKERIEKLDMESCIPDTWDGFYYAIDSVLEIITSLQQEQPEVELEKFTEKIKTFQGKYKHPESISIKGAMAFMARMFYQYPNTSRQWYESLPKATMD